MSRAWLRGVGTLAVCVLIGSPLATPAAGGGVSKFPQPQIERWTLANGMGVVFLPVHQAPVVTVQLWVHVGSKDEPRDRRGSAHMFEHMMFKGTRHVPPERHGRLIDGLGGKPNAYTTEDFTGFLETLPRQYLDFAMQLEAERMQNLLFRQDMIDTEREVVKEEIRQRQNNPITRAIMRFRELAFTRHPYAWDAAGRIEDLDRTTAAELEVFYRTYYQPNNATLIVVGDVDAAAVRASAARWFESIPSAPAPPRPADASPEPVQTRLRREVLEPSQIGLVIGGYKIPEARSEELFPLRVLASILSDGKSSRLYRRIVRRDRSGVSTGVYVDEYEHPGLLFFYAIYLEEEQGRRVEAAIRDEVARLRRTDVAGRELAKAKNQLAARFVRELQEIGGLAWQIGLSQVLRGDPVAWVDDYQKLLAVTAADVRRVAQRYLADERLTLVVVPPGGSAGGGR